MENKDFKEMMETLSNLESIMMGINDNVEDTSEMLTNEIIKRTNLDKEDVEILDGELGETIIMLIQDIRFINGISEKLGEESANKIYDSFEKLVSTPFTNAGLNLGIKFIRG